MWYANVSGKQTPLGVRDPNDQAAALAAHQALLDQLAAGIAARLSESGAKPCDPRVTTCDLHVTVTRAADEFLSLQTRRVAAGKLLPQSAENYRGHLAHLRAAFGGRPVASLLAEELEAWADRPEWSSSYRHNLLGTVGQMLRGCGIVLRIKRPPKESRGADSVLSDQQFQEVLDACRRYAGAHGDLHQLLTVLRETGARPQEIAPLHVHDVDWTHELVRRRQHKTRGHTGRDRIIHLNAAALAVLDAQRREYREGVLFRTRAGNPYRSGAIVRRLGEISDQVGYRVTAYGLGRHSFATAALVAGVPDVLVAGLLGHTGTGMVHSHYSHVDQQSRALREAAERASRRTG